MRISPAPRKVVDAIKNRQTPGVTNPSPPPLKFCIFFFPKKLISADWIEEVVEFDSILSLASPQALCVPRFLVSARIKADHTHNN
jgi:hypothetical protein